MNQVLKIRSARKADLLAMAAQMQSLCCIDWLSRHLTADVNRIGRSARYGR
jgi:hypothetical protein